MGIVDEAIQDGVGVGGVTDDTVPGGYGELAGNDRRSAAVAVLKDFQKIVTGLFVERLETPVVQNQDLNMAQGALQPGVSAVTAGERELCKEPRDTLIENGTVRGGSVCLNSFGRFAKWISASIMPPPSLVSAR